MNKTEVAVIISDTHSPFEDKASVSCSLDFIRDIQPTTVVFNGDIGDWYAASRHRRDPARKLQLQDEIDSQNALLWRYREVAPNANFIYNLGNHEDRWNNFLIDNPEFKGLRCLDFEKLLGLEEIGFAFVNNYGDPWKLGDAIVIHGYKALKNSGYTAHAYIEEWGVSGVSGHTHRSAKVRMRFYDKEVCWVEGGCLCELDPEYGDGLADWQHGFVVAEVYKGKTSLEALTINNGRLVYNGKVYGKQ